MTPPIDPLSELFLEDALPIGLGCSRLGSVGGASSAEAVKMLEAAIDLGIRFFDTANIYGQGESERLLGSVLKGRQDYVVATKAGKYVPRHKLALTPLKGVIRATVRRSSAASQGVRSVRSKPMPTHWDRRHLEASLEASLRRLAVDHVHVFMLHSPDTSVIARGEAVDTLERARQSGKVGLVGVSVDDVPAAMACLGDSRIRVLQVPLHPGDGAFEDVLDRAHRQGVSVVAREILGGVGTAATHPNPAAYARAQVVAAVRDPRIAIPLVGATRVSSVVASASAARDIQPGR